MTRSLEGRAAFITGVARGQGRARQGVNIIGVDICEDIPSMTYPNASEAELAETVQGVEAEGARMIGLKADVRDFGSLESAVQQGVDEFGRLDIIIANAGIVRLGSESDDFLQDWQDVIDTNLTGVFNTLRAALPPMRAGGRGGSVVITSSSAGLKGSATPDLNAGGLGYTAAKRGIVGMMQSVALGLAPESIRVNTIHPTGVVSGMTQNEAMVAMMAAAAEGGDNAISGMQNALPIDILQPEDVANAVAFLVSDEANYITGIQWPLDAGFSIR